MSEWKKENAVVVAKNNYEYAYLLQWCEDNGKGEPHMGLPERFPFCISLGGELAGWTDRMDRNLHYVTFEDFAKDQT